MRKTNIKSYFLIFSCIALTIFAGAHINNLSVATEDDNVVISWQSGEETNLKEYVVERKSSEVSFSEIGRVAPKGSYSFYKYSDENAYKISSSFYTYRLKIVDNDNTVSYSSEMSVIHKPSAVKRTWGSIKALFR